MRPDDLPGVPLAALLAALAESTAAVRQLSAQVERLADSLNARDQPRTSLAPLLGEIHAAAGDFAFTCADLIARADERLQAALAGRNAMALGCLLRTLARHPVAGFTVQRCGSDEDGCTLWRVYQQR